MILFKSNLCIRAEMVKIQQKQRREKEVTGVGGSHIFLVGHRFRSGVWKTYKFQAKE